MVLRHILPARSYYPLFLRYSGKGRACGNSRVLHIDLRLQILYHTFQKQTVHYFRLRTQTKLTVDAA
jgi:hypothetical protein